MTGRDLCEHCDGSGYVDDEDNSVAWATKVCKECGGEGIQ